MAAAEPKALAVMLATDNQEANRSNQLSYGDLNARANQLAHHLRRLGLRPEQIVALSVERSLEMIIALLAVLKAGGVCLPIDPALPPARLTWILADAQAICHLFDLLCRMKRIELAFDLQVFSNGLFRKQAEVLEYYTYIVFPMKSKIFRSKLFDIFIAI